MKLLEIVDGMDKKTIKNLIARCKKISIIKRDILTPEQQQEVIKYHKKKLTPRDCTFTKSDVEEFRKYLNKHNIIL